MPCPSLQKGCKQRDEIECCCRSGNHFFVDDVFVCAVIVDVIGGYAHHDHSGGPLQEAGREEQRAERAA